MEDKITESMEKDVKVLNAYAKNINGKWKKYLDTIPGFYDCPIAEAMKSAAARLSFYLPPAQFISIVTAAAATQNRVKQFIRQSNKTLKKVQDKKSKQYKEAEAAIADLGPKLADLEKAVKAGMKIVRRLQKKGK